MVERHALPMRRATETFEVAFGGLKESHVVSVGYYENGGIGELFVTGGKSGEMIQAIARDAAILMSLALQHGVPVGVLKHAVTRDGQDQPQSIIGAVIDHLPGE